jgi:hypothetical protein
MAVTKGGSYDAVSRRFVEEAVGDAGRDGVCDLLDGDPLAWSDGAQKPACFQQTLRCDFPGLAAEGSGIGHPP